MNAGKVSVTGTFKHGLKIGETVHKEFVLTDCSAADYFEAEAECPDAGRSIKFRSALAVRQLVSIGTFTGPFTLSMIGKLKPSDLQLLLDKRDEAELMGEAEQPA